ncbi:hypothetical protein NEOLEDRAFT_378341 [Neolentinus lepideus HHB14362 ss-1]|uniref:Uncharacterized protein n=1 Tax=Neolentinus lepideus HHB14362 ss-1 TaxID=1314782 RepID=A0A165SBL3_9AGAM|nr:hypothetical protein NEOLEDRAFT_378341 [Neolentinus lepideus HHB14362 ss-1]
MGALAVLSIDSGHWMAQALWFASSALAVSGVLIASLTPVVFDTFFAEDLAALDLEHGLDHGQEEAMERKDSTSSHKHLTLQSHAVLLHEIDMFIDSYKIYITVSGYCFIAGLVAFFASVRPIDTSCKIQTLPFALVSGLPAAIGWTYTVTRGFYLSWKHRLFREGLLPDPDADNYTSRVRLQEPPSHGQLPILNNGRPLDGEAQECLNFPPMHVAAPTPAAALPGNVQQSSPCISQSSTP